MHIVARARRFVESLRAIARRSEIEQRRCRSCGGTHVHRHGSYRRHPYTLRGRVTVTIQRYRCQHCGATHGPEHPDLPPGAHYSRSVRRFVIDQWLHSGSSLRRVAEWARSIIGHQERWWVWHPVGDPWGPEEERPPCRLSASTVCSWLNEAGIQAEKGVEGLYEGVASSGRLGADGLWARLRGGAVRVLLLVRDSVTGLLYPPVVAAGEEAAAAWGALLAQARRAGLQLAEVRALVSDGAQGLLSHLRRELPWVYQQRCIWHLWRNLGGELARQAARAAQGLSGEAAEATRTRVRQELTRLVHGVLDAPGFDEAEAALAQLQAHAQGAELWGVLNARFLELLTYRMAGHEGVGRVSPEWMWRDFRLRLSRGRNHGSDERLRRAGTLLRCTQRPIYRNFTPAQVRRERKRRYRHPGRCALEVAGVAPEGCSYLDALHV